MAETVAVAAVVVVVALAVPLAVAVAPVAVMILVVPTPILVGQERPWRCRLVVTEFFLTRFSFFPVPYSLRLRGEAKDTLFPQGLDFASFEKQN